MPVARRLPLIVAALAVTAGAATACTDVNGTNGKNFVTSDGVVVEIPASHREDPVDFSGETLTGDRLDVASLRGQVVVVNVWGSWCTACRSEAPALVDAVSEFPPGTSMLGVDIRDSSKDNALAYERGFGIDYPSIYDFGSQTLLSFPSPFNPRDIPSTMVLDSRGRLAALVRGELPSKLTLTELVQKVADEDG
jgi:thiol-disulfide isomerase/thioredoxin